MFDKIRNYIKNSYNELLKEVTWPTFSDLQGNALAVLVAIIIIATLVWGMDQISGFTLKTLIYR